MESIEQSLHQNLKLFFRGDDYLDHLLHSFQEAKDFVFVEVYIFAYDSLGELLVETFQTLAKRGVKIYILVDGVGSYFYITRLLENLSHPNISFRIYNPVGISRWPWTWINVPEWMRLTRTINKRDHRKLIVVDGTIAYLGSANLTAVHFERFFQTRAWRDTCFQIHHLNLSELIQSFIKIWDRSQPSQPENSTLHTQYDRKPLSQRGLFRFNFSLRQRLENNNELYRRIDRSRKHIFITTPYFLPRYRLVKHLRQARQRGVDVRLLLPEINDVPIVKWASRSFYLPLLQNEVRIFEYRDHILHAKSLVIDSWVKMGSSNLNQRSLLHDLEVEMAASNEIIAQQLMKQFEVDQNNSREFTKQDWKNLGTFEKLRNRLALLVKYWL